MAAPVATRVLLVGWDAADWRVINPLLDAGEMPHLQRLVEQGVIGNLATLYPVLSPMLWTSIATGKRAFKHGILGFAEPEPHTGRIRPVTNLGRRAKAVWNILHQNGKQCNVVGWWPSHPAEPIRGVMVSNHFQRAAARVDEPWPIARGTVHPERLQESLARLRIHPLEMTGEDLLPFVPRAAEIDQAKDKRLANLARVLAECATVHAAATAVMQLEPWDFMAVYYDAIDHFSHGFMRYRPPRQGWVSQRDYDMYKDVVAGAYRFHDMMLGVLMKLAGDETTVILISDHGFHADELRPQYVPNEPAGPAAEHRSFGIFAMKGPGIRRDERIYGASILDVTPTVLTLFGLPVGRDMDGKPLVSAFEEPPTPEHVDSWEHVAGDSGQHAGSGSADALENQRALDQLVELGYIEEPNADQQQAVAETERELEYNLARAYMGANRFADAAPLLEKCWQKWPAEQRFGVKLLDCQLAMQQVCEARSTLTKIVAAKQHYAGEAQAALDKLLGELREKDRDDLTLSQRRRLRRLERRAGINQPAVAFLEASVLRAEGRLQEARVQLQQAANAQVRHLPSVLRNLGEVHFELSEWQSAAQCFRRALALDPEDARAHLGLAHSLLAMGRNRAAARAARASLALCYQNPQAHYLFAVALYRRGRVRKAINALETAVGQKQDFAEAGALLHRLYERRPADRANSHKPESPASASREPSCAPYANRHAGAGASPEEEMNQSRNAPGDEPRSRPQSPGDVIIIVSGLPRSGTSMMMKMLGAGGVPLLADDRRRADVGNPLGYFECQKVKSLPRDGAWIPEARSKALKVVAPLAIFLPKGPQYKFIFMERDIREVLSSQHKLIAQLGRKQSDAGDESLAAAFLQQLAQAKTFALEELGAEAMIIRHRDALYDADAVARRVVEFLARPDLNVDAMVAAVDRALYRERA